MAPRQTATSEQRPLLREDVKTVDDHKAFMDKADSMTTVQKLMLNAALWGNDASGNFSYQYTLPVLQTLGLPLSLVSIDSAIGGPTATLLLPLLGWFTDQGPNPRRRKLITTISLCGVVVLSMLCIISANLLHLSYLMEQGVDRTAHLSPANLSDPFNKVHSTSSGDWEGTETTRSHELYKSETANDLRPDLMPLTNDSLANSSQRSWHEEIYQIPFKAGLGLLGFILLDIGFDASNGCIKTCVLTYAPRAEHTSLLVLGLIIQSAGGISTSAFGLVDFTSMLGLSHIEGARLTIQTTAQAAIIIIFLTTGLLIALVTIRRLHKTHSYVFEDRQPDSGPCLSEKASIRPEEHLSQSSALDGFQNSIRSSGSVRYDPSLALLEEHRHSSFENPNYPDAPMECTPLLEAGQGSNEYRRGLNRPEISSRSVSCGEGNSLCSSPGHPEAKRTSVDDIAEYFTEQKTAEVMSEYLLEEKFVKDVPALDKAETDGKSCRCKKGFKVKIFLVILSTYFSTADQFLFLMTSSDFVGKAIFEGDPTAPPDSQSLSRYQDGVRLASVGFFVYYIGFLVCSFVQPRILPLVGYRLEYATLHLLMCVTLVALSLTELLEVYFVLAALAGVKRACVQSIPFAVTNDLIQSKASERADGKNHMGLTFSMVSAAMPLSYCTVFSWIGPLEDLTGVVAAPFWVACLTSVLATCSFLAVGKV